MPGPVYTTCLSFTVVTVSDQCHQFLPCLVGLNQSSFVSLCDVREEEGGGNCQIWLQDEYRETRCRRCQIGRENMNNFDMLDFFVGASRGISDATLLFSDYVILQGRSSFPVFKFWP